MNKTDEYATLRAAHAAGARIQVWRLNEDAHHAFDGRWENIDGRPRFLQPLHLYRIDPDSIAAPSSEASEGVAVTNEMVLKAAEAFVMHRGCVDQTVSHGPIRAALEAALHPATAHTSEARDAEIARLCAQLAEMEHGFRDMASKWSHDAAEMTHGIAATAVRSCVDEVFEFLGPDYDAAMRQEAE